MAQLIVSDFGLNGREFETHRRHCVVSLSKTICSAWYWFNPGRQENVQTRLKNVEWDLKHQH